MSSNARARVAVCAPYLFLVFASAGTSIAAEKPVVVRDAWVGAPVTPYVFDGDVRDLGPAPTWQPGDPIREIPMRHYLRPGVPALPEPTSGEDPLVAAQRAAVAAASGRGAEVFTIPSRNFAGMGFTGVNPPDTVGDVGPNHFIQSINTGGGADVRIWDKAIPPNVLATFRLDTLGQGLCANGFGDPIVLYDRQADRWLLTEFSGSGNDLCVYVSQTPDPVSGGWYAYGFTMPTFPDYPKYAVWATDANGGTGSYVVTANDDGPSVTALNRGAMIAGAAATFQRLLMPELPGFQIQAPAPADPDGPNAPPTGAPAIVMRHRDTELHGGPAAPGDVLEMWLFQVDWTITSNTTLTQAPPVDVADFDSTVCGTAFQGCFPQPGTSTTLMPIREAIMNRLQYWRHDEFESLVGNFVVDVNAADRGGVRWFDVRRPLSGGPWTTHQQGTYSIDATHRWMAAVAMDQSENIALAYNAVSGSVFPSLRYTGRSFDDPLGLMTETETDIHTGTASNSSFRYGDYAAMGVDPSDDCTFWFTGMDNTATTWRTQSASFRFDGCGCLLAPTAPVLDATPSGDNEIDLFWNDADLATVVSYRIDRSRTPGGPYEAIATIADTSPGVAGGPGYTFVDTDVSGGITYHYVVVADDGDLCKSTGASEASATATGSCTLRPIFPGLSSAGSTVYATCAVDLSWPQAAPECGGPAVYNIYRSTVDGFTPSPANLVAAGIPGTSALDVNGLVEETTYYYVVRAVDFANGVEDLNLAQQSVFVAGPNTGVFTHFLENFEAADALADWTISNGPGPHRCGDWTRTNATTQRPSTGAGFYALALSECPDILPRTSTKLDSPPINLAITGLQSVTLAVDLFYNHDDGDDATIEVWNGSAWQVIWTDPNSDVNGHLTFDVSAVAVGNPGFRVRFNYQNAANDLWYSVDNVAIIVDIANPCSTASAPAPAGGAGLHADRADDAGSEIAVTWDASCSAPGYQLIWGDLATVSSYDVAGSVCALGTSGSAAWSGAPAGSVWFLVVGTDGAGTESSWGSSSFGERNGLDASGACGATLKNVTGACP